VLDQAPESKCEKGWTPPQLQVALALNPFAALQRPDEDSSQVDITPEDFRSVTQLSGARSVVLELFAEHNLMARTRVST
jgi:hypothetical protein